MNPEIVHSSVGQFGPHGVLSEPCVTAGQLKLKTGCVQLLGPPRWASGCRGTRIHFRQQCSQNSSRSNTAVSEPETATRGQERLCSSTGISGDVSSKMHFRHSVGSVSL